MLFSTCPDEHKVPLREALAIVDNAIENSDGWSEQDTYAGFCDGERWVEMVEVFEAAARRHLECGPHRKSAAEVADRMAATTHDVRPDQMMAATRHFLDQEPGRGCAALPCGAAVLRCYPAGNLAPSCVPPGPVRATTALKTTYRQLGVVA